MNNFSKTSTESEAVVHRVVQLRDRNYKTRSANESDVLPFSVSTPRKVSQNAKRFCCTLAKDTLGSYHRNLLNIPSMGRRLVRVWKPWWRGCAAHDNLVSASPNPQTQEDIQENSWIVSRSSNKPSKLVRIPCRCRLPALRTSRHADKWNCIKETVFLCAVTFKIICTVFCFFCCRLCSVTRRRFKVSEACISVNSQEEVSLQCH